MKIFCANTARLRPVPKLQILWSVVLFISVYMMNLLKFMQSAPKSLRHHQSMFQNIAATIGVWVVGHTNQNVAFGRKTFSAFPMNVLLAFAKTVLASVSRHTRIRVTNKSAESPIISGYQRCSLTATAFAKTRRDFFRCRSVTSEHSPMMSAQEQGGVIVFFMARRECFPATALT